MTVAERQAATVATMAGPSRAAMARLATLPDLEVEDAVKALLPPPLNVQLRQRWTNAVAANGWWNGALVEYQVYRADSVPDGVLDAGIDVLAALMAPACPTRIASALQAEWGSLDAIRESRLKALLTAAAGDRFRAWPADAVIWAFTAWLRQAPSLPSWTEIEETLEIRTARRRLMLESLQRLQFRRHDARRNGQGRPPAGERVPTRVEAA